MPSSLVSDRQWRYLDTGLRSAAQNIALNRVILESHQQGESPHTLRFLQFQPSALIGFHQSVAQELRVEYCKEHDIQIQRRITGGGAIYFDPSHLGWELYLSRKIIGVASMEQIAARICGAAVHALRSLGVPANFRPRNDIEVEGRKISGTGGVFAGDSFLYQGTLLLQLDLERMLSVLRVHAEKLSSKSIESMAQRVVSVQEVLGSLPDAQQFRSAIAAAFSDEFAIEYTMASGLNEAEDRRFGEVFAEINSEEWVYAVDRSRTDAPIVSGSHRCGGGLIQADISVDLQRNLLKQVWISGDFFIYPARAIPDLEADLKDTPIPELEVKVNLFFKRNVVQMYMMTVDDIVRAIHNALVSVT
jgi:lipoate-protein ligase A